MLSTYTDAIETTLLVFAALAGVATVAAPLVLAGMLLRTPARRIGWHIDAWRYRP